MNISYNWLKEYITLPESPAETADILTSIGLETGSVEEVESIKGGLKGLVIGKVLTCEDHPDSDHLHITTVDLGDGVATQIVCGAPNVAAGQTVVVATVGTTLYDGDKEFKIKKSKIRGTESYGMICAEDEIGVGTSHAGIIVIDKDVAPGTPAAEYFGLTSDYVLEVDLTPNRIDAASHYGVARDLAARAGLYGTEPANLHRPTVESFVLDKAEGGATVEVVDKDACTRYCGVTVRGVKVVESPQWLRDRLTTIGLRPINNIVDITNYLLHAMGQPLHCFDLSKVTGEKIVVRKSEEGKKFVTLDGVEHTMTSADLMICNAEEAMCIAGVFGGLDSGVTETTTDIFLESACFNPTSVRKTARRHGLSTDSSFRFERGVDPNQTMYVLKLAALMVKELAGGEICGPLEDVYPEPIEYYATEFSYEYLTSLLGKKLPEETVDKILGLLEIEIASREGDKLELHVPTYRYDVRRACDVAEEVLRIYGYNNIEMKETLHASLSYRTRTDEIDTLREKISDQLSGQGFNEILNNSLTAESYYSNLVNGVYPAEHCVKLMNPLSNDLNVMRQTLLFGGLESALRNINRRREDILMYEFGNVYQLDPTKDSTPEAPLAPYSESERLGLWLSGNMRPAGWAREASGATVYDLKAVVEDLLKRLGLTEQTVMTAGASDEIFSASLEVKTRSGKTLGRLGILNDALLRHFDIKQSVYYAELDWVAMAEMSLKRNALYTPLAKTQAVRRDLALLLDSSIDFGSVEALVKRNGGKLLKKVELFDVYEGKNLPSGKKSYAIAMTLQDEEKTLQDKQIDAVVNKIIGAVKRELSAEIR